MSVSAGQRLSPRIDPPKPHGREQAKQEGSAFTNALGILQRRWRIIAAAIVVVGAVAYLYSASQEKQYSATASVLFQPDVEAVADSRGDFVDPERQAATNEALLSLPVVARGAARRLDVDPATVASAVKVVSSRESDIVEIEATTTDPRLSMRMVNAYGEAFIGFRRASARNRIDEAINGARTALRNLTDLQRDGAAGTEVRQRIAQLETTRSLQTGGVDLVQPAGVPTEPSAPQPVRTGLLGVIVGALLGVGLAGLRERQDRTVKDVESVERLFDRPVIAEIPRSRSLSRGGAEPIGPQELEAFRMLRLSLRYFSVDVPTRSLLIASAVPGEGKSTVARHLAETMASMGDSVVLVEADLHRISSFNPGDEPLEQGLSTVLIGQDLEDSLAASSLAHLGDDERTLTVLVNGPLPPNPSELLESDRMREVLIELQSRFDLVIIDSPPLPVVSDALPLVGQVDGVLAVSGLGVGKQDEVRDLLRLIDLNGDNLLGVVVNFAERPDRSASAYYKGQQT